MNEDLRSSVFGQNHSSVQLWHLRSAPLPVTFPTKLVSTQSLELSNFNNINICINIHNIWCRYLNMKFLDPIGSLVFSVLVSKLVSDQT